MTDATATSSFDTPHGFAALSDLELHDILEKASDSVQLTAALRERDARLTRRHSTQNFWTDVFYQETRTLRDNIGGDFVTVHPGDYLVGGHIEVFSKVERYRLTSPFSIARFPVTEGMYRRFVDDGGYHSEQWWDEYGWAWRQEHTIDQPWLWVRYPYDASRARYPMTGVSYFEMTAYCAWRRAQDTVFDTIRPASAKEWDIAARGRFGRPFPWGWTQDGTRANVGSGQFQSRTPVNRYPGGVSPFGCWDMVGNARELSVDAWAHDARLSTIRDEVKALDVNPIAGLHVGVWALCMAPVRLRMRGGSYRLTWRHANIGYARYVRPDERLGDLGFRLVGTPAIEP